MINLEYRGGNGPPWTMADFVIVEIDTSEQMPLPMRHFIFTDESESIGFYSAYLKRVIGDGREP